MADFHLGLSASKIKSEPEDSTKSTLSQNCYCGKERNLDFVELQCEKCLRWFHQTCIEIPLPKLTRFLTCYNFLCKSCHPMRTEAFAKRATSKAYAGICQTALANLLHRDGGSRIAFSKDREIIPFIDEMWDALTHNHKRQKNAWHQTVMKTMMKESDLFMCDNRDPDDILFALRCQDLYKISPYDSVKGNQGSLLAKIEQSLQPQVGGARSARGGKKRGQNGNGDSLGDPLGIGVVASKRQKSELAQPKLPPSGFPTEFPYNKEGWRYFLAEPDPHAPCRQEFEELQDRIPIPNFLFRRLLPETCLLSVHDRAPQLKLSDDRRSVIGEKGYSTVRANTGVTHGNWYFEIRINDMPDNSAVRFGWGQELAHLQAPVGYDHYGYSWRSRKGTRFHQSKGKHYTEGGFGVGDVVGALIELPAVYPGASFSKYENSHYLPKTCKDKPLIKFKSYHYFEEKDEAQKMVAELYPLPNSRITFFKNGQSMGTAFIDLNHGVYFPTASLYKSASITFNFGPNFDCPISTTVRFQPICNAVVQNQVEQTLSDILYLVENEGELKLQ